MAGLAARIASKRMRKQAFSIDDYLLFLSAVKLSGFPCYLLGLSRSWTDDRQIMYFAESIMTCWGELPTSRPVLRQA